MDQSLRGVSGQAPKQYLSGVDWRYLLPISPASRVLVIDQDANDVDQVFKNFGITVTVLSNNQLLNPSKSNVVPLGEASFDIVASPLGILRNSSKVGRHEHLEIQSRLRKLLSPQGILLYGFSNRWSFHRISHLGEAVLSPWEVVHLLQGLTYKAIVFYGAFPDLVVPEYIFPIQAETISFVVRHRYHSRLPKPLVHFIQTPLAALLKNFLPYYYVVAKVAE